MRKRIYGKQLGRNTNTRKALIRSLIYSFVEHGRVKTTVSKAKAIQPEVEKLLTRAKEDTVANRRIVLAKLGNKRKIADKLFADFATVSANRNSGFTRITKLTTRRGDNTQEAVLEWVDQPVVVEEVKEVKKDSKKKESKKTTK